MKQNNSKGQVTTQVNLEDFQHSGFDMDNIQYGTGRIGRLYPVRCDYVYPGDTVKSKSTAVLQFKPLAVPLMTNMHIKQEDFYIPFNTVLDSFDDFISNGEDNDYNGVLPTLSLQQMVKKFTEYLFSSGEYVQNGFVYQLFHIDSTTDQNITTTWMKYKKYYGLDAAYPILNGNTIVANYSGSYYRTFDFANSAFYNSYVKPYMLEDLFYHVNPIVKQLDELIINARLSGFDSPYAGAGSVALFMPLSAYNITDAGVVTTTTYRHYANSVNNKYFNKIYKSLDKMVSNGTLSSNVDELLVPTDTGYAFLQLMYELYRPFFGYGSNLDMLNMNFLKFEDFLYAVLCNLMIGQNDITSTVQNGYKYKYLMLPYWDDNGRINILSEKPQDILPLRALYSVWFNNYRDQLLETDAPKVNKKDTLNEEEVLILLSPRVRCWHKDAFTTALDNAGTGNVQVPINSLQFPNLVSAGAYVGTDSISPNPMTFKMYNVGDNNGLFSLIADANNIAEIKLLTTGESWKIPTAYLSGVNSLISSEESTPPIYTTGFSLYALDAAKRAQKFLQKALFYGNRIKDFLYTHFRVKFLDARLRLPEIIGTSSSLVGMQQIMANNTIVTEQSTNVAGDRAGYASGSIETGIDHYIPEHGVVISLLSVIPDCVYSNSFDRHHAMLEQFDFPFLEFATLGLQAVYENEMMQIPCKVDLGEGLTDSPLVHGYQGMYYADKSKFSNVHGELLDEDSFYVMDREFNPYDPDSRPKLNYIFVHCHPKLDAFVVDNEWSDFFRFDVYHNQKDNRLLPVHSLYI